MSTGPMVVPCSAEQFEELFSLLCALADYEHLDRPSDEAKQRLYNDLFGERPRIEALLSLADNGKAIGFAILVETYSTFLALPTMYLEDLFVLEAHRGTGHGAALFDAVVEQAKVRGCGRMDWHALEWNKLARDFYERRGAVCMDEWKYYRITL